MAALPSENIHKHFSGELIAHDVTYAISVGTTSGTPHSSDASLLLISVEDHATKDRWKGRFPADCESSSLNQFSRSISFGRYREHYAQNWKF